MSAIITEILFLLLTFRAKKSIIIKTNDRFYKRIFGRGGEQVSSPAVPLTSIGAVMKGLRPFHDSPDGLLSGRLPVVANAQHGDIVKLRCLPDE